MWSTICSAIEPRPPAAFVSVGQAAMLAGPWQPRRDMCEASTAGVASVISAVETSPTRMPRFWAISSIVFRFAPGTFSALLGPWEMRSSIVFSPVAHIVPVEAESGAKSGRYGALAAGFTDQVVSKPVNGSRSTLRAVVTPW